MFYVVATHIVLTCWLAIMFHVILNCYMPKGFPFYFLESISEWRECVKFDHFFSDLFIPQLQFFFGSLFILEIISCLHWKELKYWSGLRFVFRIKISWFCLFSYIYFPSVQRLNIYISCKFMKTTELEGFHW